MDFPRLFSMNARLRKNPPLRAMVQAYLGIQSPDLAPVKKSENVENSEAELDDFIKMFSASGGKVG
jgi:hypothetical protein